MNPIPQHLKPTIEMLEKAFPAGVLDEFYLPVLFVLQDGMNEENLALVAQQLSPTSEGLNDVYKVSFLRSLLLDGRNESGEHEREIAPSFDWRNVAFVRAKLNEFGFVDWVKSD